jgi:hypothetical protein
MESGPARPQNMIETTDALEAVGACQSMKNFLFTLILIGLVLCQTVFWMNHFGLINKQGCNACQGDVQKSGSPEANVCPQNACSISQPQANAQNTGLIFLAATTEPVATEAQEGKAIEQAINEIVESANQTQPEAEILLEKETDGIPAEVPIQTEDEQAAAEPQDFPQVALSLFRISAPFAKGLVAVCNFIIIVSVILYCLSLLMCLKISLAGRLGGINHITRAFFISLFLLVIITPWQVVLPKVLIGSIWIPGELLCGGWAKADSSNFWKVMFYLRFCGLPFLALWLLLWTQIRSGKWTRATLRRLGVVR